MVRVLNRDYVQSFDSALDEFRFSRILLRRFSDERQGYLIAISDNIESDNEFEKFISTQGNNGELCMLGYYKEDVDDYVDY